ncbi:MAG: endonuclease/exonuclease/phosphatase family protein [Micromonosporaceae bacterium]
MTTATPAPLALAALNLHCGRDHAGTVYAVSAAISALDADVVVVQENWRPAGAESIAREAAAACDYRYCVELDVWGSTSLYDLGVVTDPAMDEPGAWGLAVLSRLPVARREHVWLGSAPGDMGPRAAQVVEVTVDDESIARVVNVHLTHRLAHGPGQLRRLVRALRPPGQPTVIAGDLNMCRPTVYLGHPYRPSVRGRTWPARRPFAQVDHVLVDDRVTVADGSVIPAVGSDHLPIRVTLHVADRHAAPGRSSSSSRQRA